MIRAGADHVWKRFLRAESGVAAIEFALMAPMLLLLSVGGYELSRLLLISLKVEKIAYTVADVVSQSTALTNVQMGNYLTAAGDIMQPYDFSGSGKVIVSSVYQSGATPPATIRWRYTGAGTLAATSKIGNVNGAATLPGGLALSDKDNVIVAEVYYHYVPLFGVGIFAAFDIYRPAVFKPRLGALTAAPS